jgi:predicted Fe-Mo cluster-binding NifX family protein
MAIVLICTEFGTVYAIRSGNAMKTRVAISAWRDRVSPVFDTAGNVLVVDVDGSISADRIMVELPNGPVQSRVTSLAENGVDVLLCGAISRPLHEMLEAAGIAVTPFLVGPVEELIQAFVDDRLSESRFIMPGCCGGRRRKRRGQRTGSKNKREMT